MSAHLLPCPFCGGKAEFGRDDGGARGIGCNKCGAGTRGIYPLKDDVTDLLVEAWNQRVPYTAAADLLSALAFCVQYDGGECLGDHPAQLAKARAAIAKAEGKS